MALPAAVVLLVGVVAVAVFKRARPAAFWHLIGWRLLRRTIRRGWRELAVNCGLSKRTRQAGGLLAAWRTTPTPAEGYVRVPRLRRIRPTRGGLTVTVVMLPGQVPDDYTARCEALANAWQVHAVRVTSGRNVRGRVTLTVLTDDPLSDVRHPRHRLEAIQAQAPVTAITARTATDAARATVTPRRPSAVRGARPWPVRRAVPASSLIRPAGAAALNVTVGTWENDSDWVLNLEFQHHWLIAGVTRSGKSNLLNAAVVGWAAVPNLAIVGIDLKGGIELNPYRPRLSALACDRQGAVALLRGLNAEMDSRYATLKAAGVTRIWDLPESQRPAAVVLLIDEAAELFAADDKPEKLLSDQASGMLGRLARLGAAAGIHLIVCGQRFGAELGGNATGIRAQLSGRVCHRVTDAETPKMLFPGNDPAIREILAITPRQPGRAVALDADNGWQPAHSYHTETALARATAKQYAHLTPHLPALTPTEGDDQIKTAA